MSTEMKERIGDVMDVAPWTTLDLECELSTESDAYYFSSVDTHNIHRE